MWLFVQLELDCLTVSLDSVLRLEKSLLTLLLPGSSQCKENHILCQRVIRKKQARALCQVFNHPCGARCEHIFISLSLDYKVNFVLLLSFPGKLALVRLSLL